MPIFRPFFIFPRHTRKCQFTLSQETSHEKTCVRRILTEKSYSNEIDSALVVLPLREAFVWFVLNRWLWHVILCFYRLGNQDDEKRDWDDPREKRGVRKEESSRRNLFCLLELCNGKNLQMKRVWTQKKFKYSGHSLRKLKLTV